tara:strand:+ start:4585 stop:5238 length:654 start_codon:yes stop_codon:yes gene_type:complete
MGDGGMVGNLELKMTELLCSKLCHDLISPIGAINNGLEFLRDDTSGMLDEATQLIGSSAQKAADRLAYYRLALGEGGSSDQIEFSTIKSLIENLGLEKNLEIEWAGLDEAGTSNIRKSNGKLLLNLTLIAADCLPRGGKVVIALEYSDDNPNITVTINGEKCTLREDVKSGLNSQISTASLTVRNVTAFYCMKLAFNCEKSLKIQDESPPSIIFRVS